MGFGVEINPGWVRRIIARGVSLGQLVLRFPNLYADTIRNKAGDSGPTFSSGLKTGSIEEASSGVGITLADDVKMPNIPSSNPGDDTLWLSNNTLRIGNVSGGADPDAVHVNVAAEISTVTEKGSPVGADLVLIEDSADSNNKKRVQLSNLSSAGTVLEADYDANTILKADSDDTPTALTVGEQSLVGRITAGVITALTATQVRTLLNVENGADVTDATNVDTAGAVMEADYDAQTIMISVADNTPVATTIAEGEIVGRAAAGNVDGLSAAQVRTIVNVEDGADVTDATNVAAAGAVMATTFDANTILKADSDNTPAALTINEQALVGRITAGVITGLTATQVRTLLNVENGADVTDSSNVDSAGAVMEADYNANTILKADSDDTPAALTVAEQTLIGRITSGVITALTATQVRTLLNVEDGADVTDAANVNSAGAVMEADYNANTVLAATSDDTPAALTIAESTVIGRIPSGNIAALSRDDLRQYVVDLQIGTSYSGTPSTGSLWIDTN